MKEDASHKITAAPERMPVAMMMPFRADSQGGVTDLVRTLTTWLFAKVYS